ncbi:rod shape-determining protein MreC [candidate division WOR-1 bacterium RIFOXYB2_FULL_42_35]|uniref:Cell shape-determining protein MreC n=1 Tax=candidate division WOR-1 bacterium RIFOXYC2_FULL_41_25 TaxID=1802586 RepID=A0A1F4TKE9_UNCSA|nr:MAG: rod shape-determining protein MreC [candidate division WOR-1 bacterium RIFOXYA2_FULL_41_14]OGC22473.1 MAG: rod shape-determining protein MreC [candidate division WOR-1 bacterium RIFOXYB2_FULL_42_35]OGC33211.1 MAG: rod shape-determining protein MreC [candidate division WOR-1 bacterium RIFOXYC2_FULL_41_25]
MNEYRPHRKRKSYSLQIVLILLALILSFSTVRNIFGFRSFLQACLYPFQFTTVSVWKGVVSTPAALFSLRDLAQQNSKLTQELSQLKPELMFLQGKVQENDRLRQALAFKTNSAQARRLIAAQVVGKSPSPWFSVLQINKGSNAGVKIDLPVIVGTGLVGRIVEVAPFSSKVMLLIDAGSSVSAVSERSRDFGIIKGGTLNKLSLRYVASGGDVKIGDMVSTSPISTYFPPGLIIGTISQASKREHDLFYYIEVVPAVDFSKLEEVFVLL